MCVPVVPFLPPSPSLGLSSSHQVCQQTPLSTDPSHQHILLSQHSDLMFSLKTKFRIGLVVALGWDSAGWALRLSWGHSKALGCQYEALLSPGGCSRVIFWGILRPSTQIF